MPLALHRRFAATGFMKIFLHAAKDRLEARVAAPSSPAAHRGHALTLLSLVLAVNALGAAVMWRSMCRLSLAQLLLCAFDPAVIAVEGFRALFKYGAHGRFDKTK